MARNIENKLPLSDRLITQGVYLAGSAVFIGGLRLYAINKPQDTGIYCAFFGAAIIALGWEYQREARNIHSSEK